MDFLTSTRIELFNPATEESYTVKSFEGLSISENIDNPIKTFSFTAKLLSEDIAHKFSTGSEVKIYNGIKGQELKLIFEGVVKEQPKSLDGKIKSYQFSGTDFLGKTQDVLINKNYKQKTISEILFDVVMFRADELGYGLDMEFDAELNYTIDIKFKNIHLYEVLEKLCGLIDCYFTVKSDENNGRMLVIREKKILKTDKVIQKNMFVKGSASFSKDASKLVNSLLIKGGSTLSPDEYETFYGDGRNKTFKLNYKPRESTRGKIELYHWNETTNTMTELEVPSENHKVENAKISINYNEKTITFDDIPNNDIRFDIVYRYEIPLFRVINYRESIRKYGLFQDVIRFPEINDTKLLIKKGREHLDKYSEPIITGTLKPFFNHYEVGEFVFVSIPEIEIDHELQITAKTLSITPNSTDITLNFENRVGVPKVLKDILERLKKLENEQDDDLVEIFEDFLDEIKIEDAVTFKRKTVNKDFIIGVSRIGEAI